MKLNRERKIKVESMGCHFAVLVIIRYTPARMMSRAEVSPMEPDMKPVKASVKLYKASPVAR